MQLKDVLHDANSPLSATFDLPSLQITRMYLHVNRKNLISKNLRQIFIVLECGQSVVCLIKLS